MSEIVCKRCGATDHVRNGIVRGVQRYRCEACGCNFTMTPRQGKPPEMKAMALLLYAMGNMSLRRIAHLLGISDVTVLNWVRDAERRPPGAFVPKGAVPEGAVIITFDEMWALLGKSLADLGMDAPAVLPTLPSPGYWVAMAAPPSADGAAARPGARARRLPATSETT